MCIRDSTWYTAVCVFRSHVADGAREQVLLDHQVRILRAGDAESAYLGALSLGEQAEHTYRNAEGASVTWEFLGLGELSELMSLEPADGTEVYSWRSRLDPGTAIKPKAELDVFRSRTDGDRTAGEILED